MVVVVTVIRNEGQLDSNDSSIVKQPSGAHDVPRCRHLPPTHKEVVRSQGRRKHLREPAPPAPRFGKVAMVTASTCEASWVPYKNGSE